MTPKQKEQFNHMRVALRRIGKHYMTPSQIQRDTKSGLDPQEYLEMAYENIQEDANKACKGVKAIT